jgi:hypothetical protein
MSDRSISKIHWCHARCIKISALYLNELDLFDICGDLIESLTLDFVVELEVHEKSTFFDYDKVNNKIQSPSAKRLETIAAKTIVWPRKSVNLVSLINRCPKLIALTITNSDIVTQECFVRVYENILKQLTKLVLEIPKTSSVQALIRLLGSRCRELVIMSLVMNKLEPCDEVLFSTTDATKSALSNALILLIENNPNLEEYKLDNLMVVLPTTIESLADHCKNLRYVTCCISRTGSGLTHVPMLLNNCKGLLKLNLTGGYCSSARYDVVFSLKEGILVRFYSPAGIINNDKDILKQLFELLQIKLLTIRIWGLSEISTALWMCIGEQNCQLVRLITADCSFAFAEKNCTIMLKSSCPALRVENILPRDGRNNNLTRGGLWASMCLNFAFNTQNPKVMIKF